jgi:hypothetical protein
MLREKDLSLNLFSSQNISKALFCGMTGTFAASEGSLMHAEDLEKRFPKIEPYFLKRYFSSVQRAEKPCRQEIFLPSA